MATVEEIAIRRLETAEKELAEIEERRKLLLWRVSEYRTLLGESNDKPHNQRANADYINHQGEPPYARMTAIQAIETILHSSGKPMKVAQIAQVAIAGGYRGGDGNIEKVVPNFSSVVSRTIKGPHSIFVRTGERGLIELTERHVPSTGPNPWEGRHND